MLCHVQDDVVVEIDDTQEKLNKARDALRVLKAEHRSLKDALDAVNGRLGRVETKVKGICALARNHYSKQCIKKDFKDGIEVRAP